MEKLIPKLRFPEFNGEWEKKKVGDISTKINSGKTPLGGQEVYVESGILFIRSQNVIEDKLSFENSTYITEEVNNTMKNSVVLPNDILLNITGASLGRSCVVPSNFSIGNVNQHVCIIRLNNENNPYFLQPIFSSEKGQTFFQSLQTGSGREGLNFQSIKGITLSFPTLPEQQKIAKFLTSVDEKLQALKQKKSLLEQYKKGVMQKIFSQELRFKPARPSGGDENGNDFPDWEEKSLGEIGEIITGKTPSTKDDSLWNGDIDFVTPTDIDENKYQKKAFRTITDNSKLKILPVKSLMFTCIASIGKMSLSIYPCITNQQINSIIPNENIDNEFLYYAVLNIVDYIKSTPSSSTLPLINKTEFSKFSILVPSLTEQTLIANFLTSIDDKINHCGQQIAKMEVWKKGLLQGMFC